MIVSYILSLSNIEDDVDTQDLKDKLNVDLERVAHHLGNFTVDPKGTDFIGKLLTLWIKLRLWIVNTMPQSIGIEE